MARMRAVDAAVRVLEKEGISCAFGVPGAGQVYASVYAPSTYTSTVNGYTISQGLWFKCMKCYPILEAEPVPYPVEK